MSPDKLVTMANQIAVFFRSKPHQEGVDGVAEHINMFWEPRMRSQLFAALENEKSGLDPLVLAAAGQIRRPKNAACAL